MIHGRFHVFKKAKAIMMFVENVHHASEWYSNFLSVKRYFIDVDIPVINLGDIEIWFHKSDEKSIIRYSWYSNLLASG